MKFNIVVVISNNVKVHGFFGWFLKLRDKPNFDETSWFCK